jgi:hypothetical protein
MRDSHPFPSGRFTDNHDANHQSGMAEQDACARTREGVNMIETVSNSS